MWATDGEPSAHGGGRGFAISDGLRRATKMDRMYQNKLIFVVVRYSYTTCSYHAATLPSSNPSMKNGMAYAEQTKMAMIEVASSK